MSEYGDVAAMFSSKPSFRILHHHRSSVGSVDNDTDSRTLEVDDDANSSAASRPQRATPSDDARSAATALSMEEVHQQLAELESAPAPTKAEIDELLAQYSDYSDGSYASGSGDESERESESLDSSSSDAYPETVILKVLIVGNARCGKTSTIARYTKDQFSDEYTSTIGADFVEKLVAYDERLTVSLQLWDIAGQDRFAKFTRAYFRDARGAVIVCDITRENTIDAVVNWKTEIDACCQDLHGGAAIPVVMVANKSDLLVDAQSALNLGVNMQKCVTKNHILEWFRTSAKSGESVDDAFQCLLDRMVLDYRAEKKRGAAETEEKGAPAVQAKVEPPPTSRTAPEIIRLSQPPLPNAISQGYGCDCN